MFPRRDAIQHDTLVIRRRGHVSPTWRKCDADDEFGGFECLDGAGGDEVREDGAARQGTVEGGSGREYDYVE
jgi:hypothetical protein